MKNQKKQSRKNISRREFMGGALATAAAFTIVPRHVLGGTGYVPPSEKLNIAGIGVGGMGANNIKAMSNENIVALCDVDDKRAAKTFEAFPNAKKYKDYRIMFDKQKDIDAVLVATPDHSHAPATMMAIKHGKHVYTQKPMTHTVFEARKITEAAREAKVMTQMGNQGHSGEGVRLICEWIWDGAIGDVREVHAWTNRPVWPQGIGRPTEVMEVPSTLDWDLWVGPSPMRPYNDAYCPFSWRGWWDFGCGALGDMACHVLDPAFSALKLKYPTSVEASSTPVNDETAPMASKIHFEFPAREGMPAVKLNWYDGGLLPERPEELEATREMRKLGSDGSALMFVGDKGKLVCGCYGDGPRIIPETKMQEYKRPEKTLPRVEGTHEQNWIDACKGGEKACSNFDYAGPFTETVVMGNIAIRMGGEKLYWDGENMKFTNNDKANEYVQMPYREGWSL
jgi:predicted dehydrogenase